MLPTVDFGSVNTITYMSLPLFPACNAACLFRSVFFTQKPEVLTFNFPSSDAISFFWTATSCKTLPLALNHSNQKPHLQDRDRNRNIAQNESGNGYSLPAQRTSRLANLRPRYAHRRWRELRSKKLHRKTKKRRAQDWQSRSGRFAVCRETLPVAAELFGRPF